MIIWMIIWMIMWSYDHMNDHMIIWMIIWMIIRMGSQNQNPTKKSSWYSLDHRMGSRKRNPTKKSSWHSLDHGQEMQKNLIDLGIMEAQQIYSTNWSRACCAIFCPMTSQSESSLRSICAHCTLNSYGHTAYILRQGSSKLGKRLSSTACVSFIFFAGLRNFSASSWFCLRFAISWRTWSCLPYSSRNSSPRPPRSCTFLSEDDRRHATQRLKFQSLQSYRRAGADSENKKLCLGSCLMKHVVHIWGSQFGTPNMNNMFHTRIFQIPLDWGILALALAAISICTIRARTFVQENVLLWVYRFFIFDLPWSSKLLHCIHLQDGGRTIGWKKQYRASAWRLNAKDRKWKSAEPNSIERVQAALLWTTT